MASRANVRRPRRSILYEKDPKTKIATITFNRPDYLNAPTSAARLRYADLLRAATVDDDVKVVVIRGVGDDLGSGADLPEFMEGTAHRTRLAELRRRGRSGRHLSAEGLVPARRDDRRSGTPTSQAGNRALQELKKISIVEAKGYCYGWHFYQCADADLVISSDDALFGHPSFRYYGWGPRMWTWVQMMGLRKFQEMVFTGRPFTAEEMEECNFLNKVVRTRRARGRDRQVRAGVCAQPARRHRVSAEDVLRGRTSSTRASTWAACWRRSSSRWAAAWPTTTTDDLDMDEAIDSGLADAVNDNDSKFPPDFRLSKKNRQEDQRT